MLIAENIVKNGMAAGTAFMDALTDLVYVNRMSRIIETGTYLGTGTTAAVVKGIKAHGQRAVFITIEVNPRHHASAVANNVGNPVECLLGLSIPFAYLPPMEAITFEGYAPNTVVDHQPKDRAKMYYWETMQGTPERQLDKAMLYVSHYPELVILDSAGHIGTLEFDYLMTLLPKQHEFYLALDDTNHVKHAKTVEKIEAYYKNELVFSTEQKFGSRIYRISVH